MRRWCVAALICGAFQPAFAFEPDPDAEEIRKALEEFRELPPEVLDDMQRMLRDGVAQSDEGMEDAARHVLETCYDGSTREHVQQLVDEAYWAFYDRYSSFDADPLLERLTIEALLMNPAFRRGSIARAGAIDLLVLCDDTFNETATKFPTELVQILSEDFAMRDSYEVRSLIGTFARRVQPADKLLWYPIPSELLRSKDAYEVWQSFGLFDSLGVLSANDESYLRTLIAKPEVDAPALWKQLDEPLEVRRVLSYPQWDRTMFRAEAVATVLSATRDPESAIAFVESLRGRARIDAARGIVDALWTHADHDFDETSSPFAVAHWTPERFTRLFDVLDAILLDPRARLIVGTEFTTDEWGEGEWYYDSVVGDLVDLYDSPIEIVAERSVAISKLAAAMHGDEEAARVIDRWIEEQGDFELDFENMEEVEDFMPG